MSQPIKVMQSLAFKEAYNELAPQFERASGRKLETLWVSSVHMLSRLKEGEVVDVAILATTPIDELTRLGKFKADDCIILARSGIGIAVRAGAPKPDISSGEAVKKALLAAKGVAYSTGPSGVYIAELVQRMGIADALKAKTTVVTGQSAGEVVARGEAEICFQQICELLPVAGIELVGPLPPDIQKITVFGAAVHANAPEREGAKELLKFFKTAEAAKVIRKTGLEPV